MTDFADLTARGRTARVRHRSLSSADLVATVARTVVADVSAHMVATDDTFAETAVAVTHPVSYSRDRVLDLREALDEMGLAHAALVAEPVAAAAWLSVAHGPLMPGLALVYDLGGSGLTVTLVRIGAGAPSRPVIGEPLRSSSFGGRAFGAKMATQDNWRGGETSAESDAVITALRTAHVRESLDVVYECLGRAHVTMADVDCVLVVGGAARPPEVASVLSSALARPVIVAPDPERTIAEGAAILARNAAEAARESEHCADSVEQSAPPRMLRRRLSRVAVTAAVAAGGALFAATAVVGDEASGAHSMGAGLVHVQR
ncbi:Hsp70 family protein [Nocardia spumae]|uniref:Hsp70 family protein n=1 Tax=Nocardia spumae TaxID=2887190 RepID=UPI001D14A69E|nr:Hsp70 family protein [Nocardia spumae]